MCKEGNPEMIVPLECRSLVDQAPDIRKPSRSRIRFRLCGCFLVSLCIHAGLLLTLGFRSASDLADQNQTILSVELVHTEATREEPTIRSTGATIPRYSRPGRRRLPKRVLEATSTTTPKLAQTVPPPNEFAAARAEVVRAARPSESPPSVAATAAGVPRPGPESARARLRVLLLTDFARRFTYPAIAVQRGWEGSMLLSVTVNPNGVLDRIHITQSSGYDVLDRSALDTMRRVGQLAGAREWLGGNALELLLPVVYRLPD